MLRALSIRFNCCRCAGFVACIAVQLLPSVVDCSILEIVLRPVSGSQHWPVLRPVSGPQHWPVGELVRAPLSLNFRCKAHSYSAKTRRFVRWLTTFRSCCSLPLLPAAFIRETDSEYGNGPPSPALLSDAAVSAATEEATVLVTASCAAMCWQSNRHARLRLCLFLSAVKRCTCAWVNSIHIY